MVKAQPGSIYPLSIENGSPRSMWREGWGGNGPMTGPSTFQLARILQPLQWELPKKRQLS